MLSTEYSEWPHPSDARSLVRDGGRLHLGFAPAPVDVSLVCWLLLSALVALLIALLIEKHDRQLAAASEPTGSPYRDEPMDVDASPPFHSLSLDGHASQGLPFPGEVVNGTHEVVHYDLTNLPRAGLRDLCDAFRLGKTGNKTDRLNKLSADRKGWDGLLAGTRKKHRDGGVTKNTKGPGKRASTKHHRRRRHGLDDPCLPTEESKDTRTDEERAAVLAWADSFVARNPYIPEVELENEPLPPDVDMDTSNVPSSPEGPLASTLTLSLPHPYMFPVVTAQLQLQLQQLQAQLAALTTAIASGNDTGVVPSPAAVAGAPAPAPAPAHRGPGPSDSATTTTDTDTI
ncbi:hypothetical protein EDB89DRAFT_2234323 [Lactarius sanguifluus]|nr:hypothetical protein EDB89DRAFT_2234323 [Lactarius sanguifluus]